MEVKDNNLVEKSNALNTLMCKDMNLTEFRFFCLYLSKLNARNDNARTVDISIKEFETFFGIKFNTTLFNKRIMEIATRGVKVRENGKIRVLTLYSEFCWSEVKPTTITITCNDKMLPYIFNLKKNYTTYMVGNIAKLNTIAKIRLYEICKQYQKLGVVRIPLEELQSMLCSEMSEFKNFKRKTIDPAVKDINEHTDIKISYEKNLFSRKVVALTFRIVSKEQISKDIISSNDDVNTNQLLSVYYKCNQEYTLEQIKNLWTIVETMGVRVNLYIISTYFNIKAKNKEIKNIYNYTLAIINAEAKQIVRQPILDLDKMSTKPCSYDDSKDLIDTDIDLSNNEF